MSTTQKPDSASPPKVLLRDSLKKRLRNWAARFKNDIFVLGFALKHPRTPWYAKVSAGIVIGYAFSPIDLIPDFVPVLGYLDDVILLPLGIMLTLRMIPSDVVMECREAVRSNPKNTKPKAWGGACVIAAFWLVILYTLYTQVTRLYR